MKTLALYTCAAVLLGASAAYAAGPSGEPNQGPGPNSSASGMDTSMATDNWMKMVDTNSDSMISKAEHTAATSKMFMDADTNSDGMLTKDEVMAAHSAMEKKSNM